MSFRQKKNYSYDDSEMTDPKDYLKKRDGGRRTSEPLFGPLRKVKTDTDIRATEAYLENGGVNQLIVKPWDPIRNRFKNKTDDEPEQEPQVSDLFLKTDVAGLPELYEAKSCLTRIMWAIILTFAVFFMVSELYDLFIEYRDNPILTTYSIISEGDGLSLPTIYLCPMTPIHEGQRAKMNIPKWWEEERNTSLMFQSSGLSGDEPGSILGAKKTVWEEIESTVSTQSDFNVCDQLIDGLTTTERPEYIPKDIEDYFMKVGYPIEALFRECSFNSDSFDCKEVIEEVFDRDYGKCFLLKDKERFIQRLPGIGLSFALNLDTRKAYSKNPPLFDGIVMKIEHDFDMAGYRKLLLHPAQYGIVGLKATKYNLIEQIRPSGGSQQCRDAEEGEEELKVLESAYTLGVCRMDCVQYAVMQKCGCILPMSSNYMKPSLFEEGAFQQEDYYCTYTKMQSCAFPFIKVAKSDADFKECYNKCKVPCEFWEFNAEMSAVRFPSDQFLNPSATKKKRKRKKRAAEKEKKESWDKYYRIKRHAEKVKMEAAEKRKRRAAAPGLKRVHKNNRVKRDVTTTASVTATTEGTDYYQYNEDSDVDTTTQASGTDSTTQKSSGTTESKDDYYQYKSYEDDDSSSNSTTEKSTGSTAASSSGATTEASTGSSDNTTEATDYYDDYVDDSDWIGLSSAEQAEVEAAERQALIEACTKEDSFNTQDWNDYIVVDIAFSNLQYTEITQESAISFTQTVSDVGGQIGLWVGCSIISFFKMFMVSTPLFIWSLKKKRDDKIGKRKAEETLEDAIQQDELAQVAMDTVDQHKRKLTTLLEEDPTPGSTPPYNNGNLLAHDNDGYEDIPLERIPDRPNEPTFNAKVIEIVPDSDSSPELHNEPELKRDDESPEPNEVTVNEMAVDVPLEYRPQNNWTNGSTHPEPNYPVEPIEVTINSEMQPIPDKIVFH